MHQADVLRALADAVQSGRSCAAVTMLDARGSVPQEVGAKAVIDAAGLIAGTIGGGRLEAAAISHARNALGNREAPRCEVVTWNLQRDIGMTCGGEVTLLFETFPATTWEIAIFGAGHVARALIPILATLECRVSVFDSRSDQLALAQACVDSPRVRFFHREPLEAGVEETPDGAFVLAMTQGHKTDLPVLAACLRRLHPFPYLGVIGSASKAATLRRELRADGIPEERIADFYCPIGLPLGRDTPEEIAISIAAQLLQLRP